MIFQKELKKIYMSSYKYLVIGAKALEIIFISDYQEVHGRDIYFAKSEQCYYLTSMDAEAAAVRLILPLHRKRHIPESYSIVYIDVKQHQTLPIFNLVFDPMTLTCCFCF